jgi:putative ABC transport system permease protein
MSMLGPSLHDRVFRAVLKLFPREFRGDFGEQMADDFRDQREDATRRRRRVRLWTRTVVDALRRAPAEHVDILRRDAGYALRLFRRNPGFAAAVVLTLAIGVGSTTAVFTLADPMLFRPLPYPESERIVEFLARSNGKGTFMHLPDFLQAEASRGAFEAVATFGPGPGIGRIEGLERKPFAYEVTHRFFDVVRVRPFIGREFLPEEYRVNGTGDAVIVTFGFWQRAFGGRPDILEQTLTLTGAEPRRLRIVGVLPPAFDHPDDVNRAPDVLFPRETDRANMGNPNRLAWPIARLTTGATMTAAAWELQSIFRETERQFPQFVQGREARVRSLREGLFGRARTPLLMLLGATGCVLLLSCANLAHLFMARLRARQREFAVRLAIGAGRGRLIRLLLMEAAVFALAGGVGALVFAYWTFELVMARLPEFGHIYRLLPSRLDVRVTAFAASLVALALLIFGALPAFRASRLDVRGRLLNGGTATPARRGLTGDGTLIFVQSGVAIALLVTAALFVRSFIGLAYQPLT